MIMHELRIMKIIVITVMIIIIVKMVIMNIVYYRTHMEHSVTLTTMMSE